MPSRPGRYGTRDTWVPRRRRRGDREDSSGSGTWTSRLRHQRGAGRRRRARRPAHPVEAEVGVDLAGRGRPVHRVEVQARRTGIEQVGGTARWRCRRRRGARRPDRRRPPTAATTHAGISAPLMRAMRSIWRALVIGMMPGITGLVTPRSASSSTSVDVVAGLEEELGDGEVGDGQLGGEMTAVAGPVGRRRVDLGVSRHADRERPGGGDVGRRGRTRSGSRSGGRRRRRSAGRRRAP